MVFEFIFLYHLSRILSGIRVTYDNDYKHFLLTIKINVEFNYVLILEDATYMMFARCMPLTVLLSFINRLLLC